MMMDNTLIPTLGKPAEWDIWERSTKKGEVQWNKFKRLTLKSTKKNPLS